MVGRPKRITVGGELLGGLTMFGIYSGLTTSEPANQVALLDNPTVLKREIEVLGVVGWLRDGAFGAFTGR